MCIVGADRNRSLRALQSGVFSPRCLANRTTAIPLRDPAARGGSQNDDAKHYASPGVSSISEVAADATRRPRIGNVVAGYGPPPSKCRTIAGAYLRAAQAYMLISMPTGTSTIFGVFQDITGLLLERDDFALRDKVMRF